MHDAVGLKMSSINSYPEIERYFDEQYDEADRADLENISREAVTEGPMDPNCRVVFNIPIRHNESHLDKTLDLYLNQTALKQHTDYEIVVLINSPTVNFKTGLPITDEDLKDSMAYKEAIQFQTKHPKPKISVLFHRYQPDRVNISRIRKHLMGFTIKRALESDHTDLNNLVVVTHDADMQHLNPKYVEKVDQMFREDVNLDGFGGGLDYPYEEFADNHLLFSLIRFDDIMERAKYMALYDQESKKLRHYAPMKGGNSIFRVGGYLREGGHGEALKNEHGNLRTAFLQKDAFRSKRNSVYTIVTSARRYIRAISADLGISERLDNFGQEGDLAEMYGTIPEEQFRFAPDNPWARSFPDALSGAMNRRYFDRVQSGEDAATTQAEMIDAANKLGLEIEFRKDKTANPEGLSEYVTLKTSSGEISKEAISDYFEAKYAEVGSQNTKRRREMIRTMKESGKTLGFDLNFNDLLIDKNGIRFTSLLEAEKLEFDLKEKGITYMPAKKMKVSIDLNQDKRIIEYLEKFLTSVYRRYGERGAAEIEGQKARMVRAARFMGLKISFHTAKEKNGTMFITDQDIDKIHEEMPAVLNERKNLIVRIDDYEGLRDYVINKFGPN